MDSNTGIQFSDLLGEYDLNITGPVAFSSIFVDNISENTVGNTVMMGNTLTSQSIIPDIDSSRNIGSASKKYSNLYIVSLGTNVTTQALIPDVDNTRDLGSISKRFANAYLNNMVIGTTTMSSITLTSNASWGTIAGLNFGINKWLTDGNVYFDQGIASTLGFIFRNNNGINTLFTILNTLVTSSIPMQISSTSNQLILGTTNTITINANSPAGSRIYTLPDVLNNANFIMSEGTQTINGPKTFSSVIAGNNVSLFNTSNQITLGSITKTFINANSPVANRTYTMPDVLADANFIMSEGTQTINGPKTVTNLLVSTNTTDATSTSTGSINTTGGIGIAKNIYAGGAIVFPTQVGIPSTTLSNIEERATNQGLTLFGRNGVLVTCWNGSAEQQVAYFSYNPTYLAPAISMLSTLDVQDAANASFVTLGGMSVQQKMRIGTILNVFGTTDSSSTSTGTIITTGGIGVAKTIYTGGGIALPTVGGTPTILTYYEQVNFNSVLAGALGTAAPTCIGNLTRIGNVVTYNYQVTTGLASSTAQIVWATNLPARFTPSVQRDLVIGTQNGAVFAAGLLRILTTGQIQCFSTIGTGSFTSGGTVGFYGGCVSWTI
jgi:hypothetical protein